ncbi:MAG: tetratricopeptide repeat protein [Balneola sp.]
MILILILIINFFPFTDSRTKQVDLIHEQVYEIMESYPDSALVLCDKAIKIGEQLGYDWGIANSYYIKGYIHEEVLNKGVTGLLHYLKAAHILENDNDPKAVKTYSSLMLNAGSILRIHGKYELAIEQYLKAIDKCSEYDLGNQELKLNYNLAYAYMDNGDLLNAKEVMKKTASLAMIAGNNKLYHDGYNMLGIIHMQMGDLERAKEYFEFIVQLSDASSKIKADALNNLGEMAYHAADYGLALQYYSKAKEISKDVDHSRLKFSTNLGLTKAYYKAHQFQEGISSGLDGIRYIEVITPEHDHLEIYYVMSMIYSDIGNLEKENEYKNTYYRASKQFFKDQEELIKVKEEFQIDLLLAGLQSEFERESIDEKYQKYVIISVTSLLFLIILWYEIRINKLNQTARAIRKIIDQNL